MFLPGTDASVDTAAKALQQKRWAIAYPTIAKVGRNYPDHLAKYLHAATALAGVPAGPLVDAATGCGYGLAYLLEHLPQVSMGWGVDCNEILLEYAFRHYNGSRTRWRKADLAQPVRLPLALQSVAAVVSIGTIEHLSSPEHLLAEARRLLMPEGLLVLTTPHRPFGNPWHVHEYDLQELAELLPCCGFEILSVKAMVHFELREPAEAGSLAGKTLVFVARPTEAIR